MCPWAAFVEFRSVRGRPRVLLRQRWLAFPKTECFSCLLRKSRDWGQAHWCTRAVPPIMMVVNFPLATHCWDEWLMDRDNPWTARAPWSILNTAVLIRLF